MNGRLKSFDRLLRPHRIHGTAILRSKKTRIRRKVWYRNTRDGIGVCMLCSELAEPFTNYCTEHRPLNLRPLRFQEMSIVPIEADHWARAAWMTVRAGIEAEMTFSTESLKVAMEKLRDIKPLKREVIIGGPGLAEYLRRLHVEKTDTFGLLEFSGMRVETYATNAEARFAAGERLEEGWSVHLVEGEPT